MIENDITAEQMLAEARIFLARVQDRWTTVHSVTRKQAV